MRHALIVALMCSPVAVAIAQAARTIPVSVITDFGGAQDEPAGELVGVTGVVRTDDGRFVVVNGKPLEVRVYDARGRLQRRLGRAGNGPGEFRYAAFVRQWAGDSVLTFSSSTRRWILFGLDGTLVREWPLGDGELSPQGARLIGGAFALNALGPGVDCRAAVIRRLAPATGALHQVAIDPSGRIWLRPADGEAWKVYDAAGRALGTMTVPGLLPTQFVGDAVVGYRLDADDFPHVLVVRPALPAAPAARLDCPSVNATSARSAEVKTAMRNAMTAAEATYADKGRYPRDYQEVAALLPLPQGIAGRFEPSDGPNGFAFSAWEVATGYRCVVSVGYAIRGYPDGSIGCGI